MQAIGYPDRHVVGRKDNIVIVNFRAPDPPTPCFPGAGALRSAVVAEHDSDSYENHLAQLRFVA
jgi:hypothetical protein